MHILADQDKNIKLLPHEQIPNIIFLLRYLAILWQIFTLDSFSKIINFQIISLIVYSLIYLYLMLENLWLRVWMRDFNISRVNIKMRMTRTNIFYVKFDSNKLHIEVLAMNFIADIKKRYAIKTYSKHNKIVWILNT